MIGCCLVREQSSLKAFWYVARNWRRVLEKRREIMSRRRVTDEYLASWFSYSPVSLPAPKPAASTIPRTEGCAAVGRAGMRIAILGTRGIPARYGGFETFAEELSRAWWTAATALLSTAANRSGLYLSWCRSAYVPTIRHKYLDTLAHTFRFHFTCSHRHDVALYCNAANAIFCGCRA